MIVDHYALSRYFNANSRSSAWDRQESSLSGSEIVESQQIGPLVDESELRLGQLQHQLSSNEPGALMHLVEDVPGEDEEDNDTRECKKLFKDMKFFLNREVSPKVLHHRFQNLFFFFSFLKLIFLPLICVTQFSNAISFF